MDQVEEVKGKVDIVQLVGEYVKLTKAGRNFKGLCPFHSEKTPSFMVNPELQIYKCFGCGEGGDAYAFWEKMEGVEFGEALKALAKRVGVTLISYTPSQGEEDRERLYKVNNLAAEFYHYLLTKHRMGEPARKYLEGRKITDKAVERFKLGFVPEGWDYLIKYLVGKKGFKIQDMERAGLVVPSQRGGYDRFRNRIMFPLNNHRGQTVGFAGRVLPGGDEKTGKYVNTPETEIYHKGDLLYGLDINKVDVKNAGAAVVVEGELDAIASWQAGVHNVVAIKGSALTIKQVDILKRYTETIVLALDADLAGDMAARRGIEIAEKAGMMIKVINPNSETLNPKHFKDPGDFGVRDPEGWKKAVAGAVPIYDYYIESAVERYGLEAIGKNKISKELVPIWSKIEDEILKSHYVNKLADILEVEAQAVWVQIQKILNSKFEDPNKSEILNSKTQTTKTRREVVEEDVVRLALLGERTNALYEEPIKTWISDEFWQRVNHELEKGVKVQELPAELKGKVADLLMTEWEFSEQEWDRVIKELEKEYIKDKRMRLDPGKDLKEIRNLDKRYNDLTRE